MKLFKYVSANYKLIIYSIVSIIIALMVGFISNILNKITLLFMLFLNIFLLLFIIRITDDIFDYNKDKKRKKQILAKKELIIADILFTILFVIMNLYQYHLLGTISLLFILYIILQQKFEILKVFFMFLSSTYYLYINSNSNIFSSYLVLGYLALCLIFSILFYCYKRSK